ncbi:hypothetical protein RHSP_82545 [Rhizobium freirei PRF 81]|uniref:Uncharacterized protein n=1 Tax=Rhizobium freirei PRF 81 TaxID=363754 RepID=N6TYY5_9HYPH|nr:hypothetical protein RHSP_82545 [Rhizobium freirei PRF 81]
MENNICTEGSPVSRNRMSEIVALVQALNVRDIAGSRRKNAQVRRTDSSDRRLIAPEIRMLRSTGGETVDALPGRACFAQFGAAIGLRPLPQHIEATRRPTRLSLRHSVGRCRDQPCHPT